MASGALREPVSGARQRLQAAARQGMHTAARRPAVRRLLAAAADRLEAALDATVDDGIYGGSYFGLGRNVNDRASLSGYERYDRGTSNADLAAYLAWSTFDARRTLDVGCATGFVVEALRDLGLEAEGVDVSRYAVDHAAPGARGHLRRADLRRGLPLPDGYAELVTVLETLEHLEPEDVPRALAELRRVTTSWVMATIPSFGPNRNGPGGWFQVKVRDDRVAYYESLGPRYEGPIPYGDLYRDAAGQPIEGHLTIASFSWWSDRFADAGFIRCDAAERRLHPELARLGLTKYWNLYIFRTPTAAEPKAGARSEAELASVRRRFRLDERQASEEDLAAVRLALEQAPALSTE